MGDSLLSWLSKKQSVIARSSPEAEYRALATVYSEVLWVHALLKDLQVLMDLPILVYCNSAAAIAIASNLVYHGRTKHIELD